MTTPIPGQLTLFDTVTTYGITGTIDGVEKPFLTWDFRPETKYDDAANVLLLVMRALSKQGVMFGYNPVNGRVNGKMSDGRIVVLKINVQEAYFKDGEPL